MMKRQLVFSAILLFSLLLSSLIPCCQIIDFECYGPGNGLPVDGVYDLEQDSLGRLLIASDGAGLIRFDGRDFQSWNRSNSDLEDHIRCVHPRNDEEAWIGTAHSGLWKLSHGEVFDTAIDTLKSTEIRDIVTHGREVWIATKGKGVFVFEEEQMLRYYLPNITVRTLLKSSQNEIWAGTDEGIFHLKEDTFEAQTDSLTQQKTLCLFEDSDGQIWAGLQDGLIVYNGSTWSAPHPETFGTERVKSIAQDVHGDLWLGTRNALFEWRKTSDEIVTYTTSNGLSNDRVRDLHTDIFGGLWIGTYYGGICHLEGQSIEQFGKAQGFEEEAILQVKSNSTATFYLTGDNHLFSRDLAGTSTEIALFPAEIIHWEVSGNHQVFLDVNGDIYELSEDQMSVRRTTRNNQAKRLRLLNDRLFTVSDHLITSDQFRVSSIDLACDQLNDIAFAGNQACIATNCGVFLLPIQNGTLTLPKEMENLVPITDSEGIEIRMLYTDESDIIWAVSANAGLYSIDGEEWTHHPKKYLNDLRILDIQEQDEEVLWVLTRTGVNYLQRIPGDDLLLDYESFESGALFSAQLLSIASTNEGGLWAGTTRGMFRFSPEFRFSNPTPPQLSLTNLRIDYEDVRWDSLASIDRNGLPIDLRLPYDQNHITFDFQGIDLSANEAISFQCRLAGLEDQWVDLGTIQNHTYPDLAPGEYSFLLRGKNSDGKWNELPLSYSFGIAKPWFMETWFIVTAALALLFLSWSGVQLRLRNLKRKNEKLERIVLERTKEVRMEREKSEELLLNILPKDTAEELKEHGKAKTRIYGGASVLFSDLKGFTQLTEKVNAEELVDMLDEAFKRFDRCCDEFNVEKIKTIGDAYMCATGIPSEDPEHAVKMVAFAQSMLRAMDELNEINRSKGLPTCGIRIGIHSGPLIAGVVGEKKFAYDVWGDTVNIAARMESSGEVSKINLSESTYSLVRDHFDCVPRGKVKAKNKGELEMYFVE